MLKVKLSHIKALFLNTIVPFHTIERDTTLPLPNHRPDNDAEHSWSLALMATALAPELDDNLDVGKIAIYAIVHDLVEVYAGDTSVWASDNHLATKHKREQEGLDKLGAEFPEFSHLYEYISNYESQKDDESKFVYALDKFLNLLSVTEDKGYFYHKNKITKQRYLKQLKNHRAKAHTHPLVAYYYDQLRDEFDNNPENF